MLLPSETPEFHRVVWLLKQLAPRYRVMALHAAMFWDDERLEEASVNGDAPGCPGEFKPKAATRPAGVLKLVPRRE
jgi:hypothetical protein